MHRIVFYIALVIVAVFIILSQTFSPLWLLLLVLTMLWPERREETIRPLFLLTIVFFILYFVIHYSSIIMPFILGLGIAYVLSPLVGGLERKRISRTLAILIVLIPIIAFVPFLLFLIVLGLIDEMQGLLEKIPVVVGHVQTISNTIVTALSQRGITIDPNILSSTLSTQLTNIISGLAITVGQIGRTIGSIIILLYNLVFIPLSAYLFLYDRERIHGWFRNLFAAKDRDQIDEFITRLNVSLARFFRGSLLMMLVVGCIIGVSLYVLDIKYYLFLGIIAGLCNIVPNIGYLLSFVPAIVIGSLSPVPLVAILKICGVYVGEQLVENFLLGPLIIGTASKLHPVVVMLVLVLGGALFGVWGVIIAVPLTLFTREFLNYFLGLSL